jgi:hypothetical protein
MSQRRFLVGLLGFAFAFGMPAVSMAEAFGYTYRHRYIEETTDSHGTFCLPTCVPTDPPPSTTTITAPVSGLFEASVDSAYQHSQLGPYRIDAYGS